MTYDETIQTFGTSVPDLGMPTSAAPGPAPLPTAAPLDLTAVASASVGIRHTLRPDGLETVAAPLVMWQYILDLEGAVEVEMANARALGDALARATDEHRDLQDAVQRAAQAADIRIGTPLVEAVGLLGRPTSCRRSTVLDHLSDAGAAALVDWGDEIAWHRFLLDNTVPRGPFSAAQVDAARRFRRENISPRPGLREGADGDLLMVWGSPKERYFIEASINKAGYAEWFGRDSDAGEHWDDPRRCLQALTEMARAQSGIPEVSDGPR